MAALTVTTFQGGGGWRVLPDGSVQSWEGSMDLIDCTYRLPPELLKLLREQAEDMGISQQEFVRQSLWGSVARPRNRSAQKERRFHAVLDADQIEELERTGKVVIKE